jgi:hypothetical protein
LTYFRSNVAPIGRSARHIKLRPGKGILVSAN